MQKRKAYKIPKLWFEPYIVVVVIENNAYMIKDECEMLFYYTTNGSDLKHYFTLGQMV